jgi:hypothetical protein
MGWWQTVYAVNSMLLRPFRQRVDMELVALVLVLLLAIAGQWHLVVERIDVGASTGE